MRSVRNIALSFAVPAILPTDLLLCLAIGASLRGKYTLFGKQLDARDSHL
jgi:hypothetical protein